MGLSIDEQFGLDEAHSYSIPGRGKTGDRDIEPRAGHAALRAIGDVFGGSLYASGSDETNLLSATDVGRDRSLEDRLRRAEADRDDAQAQVRNLEAEVAEAHSALAAIASRHTKALEINDRIRPLVKAFFEWTKCKGGSPAEVGAEVGMIEASRGILPGDYE